MHQIHASQIKAARAVLDWSREDLAQATGLSINTIRNLELGYISPRGKTTHIIRQAIENAGLEFTEAEGIKRRTKDVRVIDGSDSCDILFDDILQTVKKKASEVAAIFGSQEMMAKSLGAAIGKSHNRLEELNASADGKCLLSETKEPSFSLSRFEFRAAPKHRLDPASFYIYGNKFALVLPEGNQSFRFVIFNSISLAQSYRDYFSAIWNTSAPLAVSSDTKKQRVIA